MQLTSFTKRRKTPHSLHVMYVFAPKHNASIAYNHAEILGGG